VHCSGYEADPLGIRWSAAGVDAGADKEERSRARAVFPPREGACAMSFASLLDVAKHPVREEAEEDEEEGDLQEQEQVQEEAEEEDSSLLSAAVQKFSMGSNKQYNADRRKQGNNDTDFLFAGERPADNLAASEQLNLGLSSWIRQLTCARAVSSCSQATTPRGIGRCLDAAILNASKILSAREQHVSQHRARSTARTEESILLP
jgi:hypothetical protein